jgi:alpha-tubulin suppressor-like RCC1 family protein
MCAADGNAFAIGVDGVLFSWGLNENGLLGQGDD